MPDANEVKEKELNETNVGGGPGIQKSLHLHAADAVPRYMAGTSMVGMILRTVQTRSLACKIYQIWWLNRSSAKISKTTKAVFSLVRSR